MIKNIVRAGLRWHRLLLWPAFFSAFLFVLSGFTHILMTWTGPQAAQSLPPQASFATTTLARLPAILQQQRIGAAAIIKLVPSEHGNLLQVSSDEKTPRRYFYVDSFNADSGTEIIDGDQKQAVWLARYYAGHADFTISKIEYLTAFDSSYPWVNRLLPVYRITLDDAAHTTLTVHTESGALADINNDWKRSLQTVFQQLHTFRWLAFFPAARVVLMMFFLCCLLASVLAGASLLYAMPSRNIPQSRRRWHRRIAHLLWIPLSGFVASGIYHLLYSELATDARGLRLLAPLQFVDAKPLANIAIAQPSLYAINLLQIDKQLLLRASVAPAADQGQPHHGHAGHEQRNARFDGINKEQAALYFDAYSGEPSAITDEAIARSLAAGYLHTGEDSIIHSEKITRFGPEYDFRNKRLPVWRVDFNTAQQDSLFIDVASGVLVDNANNTTRAESYSFSFLHKWNMLTPLTGREWRDGLIVATLGSVLVLAVLGFFLRRK
jgi:hypothetical protein